MFSLSDLLRHPNVTIQCHNYPDADSIACGFAVYSYLRTNGVNARLVYGGAAIVSKPNLKKMIQLLDIPLQHVPQPETTNVLVTVDCQHGEGNVAKFCAKNIYQIDHHTDTENGLPGIINSGLGSCSTLVWSMFQDVGFDICEKVSTALYYGLYTDTNGLEEISHPLDRDLRDNVDYDMNVIDELKFCNLTIQELHIAGQALTRYDYDKDRRFAIFKAEACDQNVLGFISDLALTVEGVDACIVYNCLPSGCKLSVRSCTREIMANDLAKSVAGGGGHKRKAGGFIPKERLGDRPIGEFLAQAVSDYCGMFDMVYADNHSLDPCAMERYKKKKIPVGYAVTSDIFPSGTPILLRTLEGDSDVVADCDIFLMIGPEGEVYPIKKEKHQASYVNTSEGFLKDFIYTPTAKNIITNESVNIIKHAKPCIPTGESFIHARALIRHAKVFTRWATDGYMLGLPGDFIAVRADDFGDVYIIKRHIFHITYEKESS